MLRPLIALVAPYLERGGTERHIAHLINTFPPDLEAVLIAPEGPGKQFIKRNVRHFSFKRLDQSLLRGVREFKHALREAQELAGDRPFLIHVHGAPELLMLAKLSLRQVPFVFTVHGYHGFGINFDYRFAAWAANRFAEQTICVSKDEYRKLKIAGIKSQNLNAIYNGVPDQDFSTDEARRKLSLFPNLPVIGCVARLEQPKGIEYLIKACGILLEKGIAVQLVLIGWGSEESALKQIAGEYPNLPVMFTGALEETGSYYKLFDLYVQPSLVEPLGITAIEAMRAGLPVIASQVGGLAELVINNETGILIPPGNAEAISVAIQKLLADQALAQKMGQAGRERFLNHFTVEQTTKKTVEVYKKAIK